MVSLTRPDSARAPSSPISVYPKVERGQVDEARQRPRALGADLVARKVERGQLDEARQRPRALGADPFIRRSSDGQADEARQRPRALVADAAAPGPPMFVL